jgi:hypothetical protein
MADLETNIPIIAQHVFSGAPKAPGSIQLGLEDCVPPHASLEEQSQVLSEVLMLLFLEGIRIRFGADQKPETISPEQLLSMTDYVRSYGFCFLLLSKPLDEPPPVSRADRLHLKDFSERFYDFDRKQWHELSFDFVRVVHPHERMAH